MLFVLVLAVAVAAAQPEQAALFEREEQAVVVVRLQTDTSMRPISRIRSLLPSV